MNANRHHAHRPTRITESDRERMAKAVAQADAARARSKFRAKCWRAAVGAIGAITACALFYGAAM